MDKLIKVSHNCLFCSKICFQKNKLSNNNYKVKKIISLMDVCEYDYYVIQ